MSNSVYDTLNSIAKDETDIRRIRRDYSDLKEMLKEDDKEDFSLIMNVCSMHLSNTNGTDVFKSFFVFDGKRSFNMDDLKKDDINRLQSLDFAKLPLVIRTRIEDVLWCTDIEDRYVYGQNAVYDYIELFNISFSPNHWALCLKALERGSSIAAQLGKGNDLHQKCLSIAFDKLVELDGKDNLYCSIRLAELLVEHGYLDIPAVLEIIDKIIVSTTDIDKLEKAHKLKIKTLKANKQSTEECELELADIYTAAANEISNLDNVYAAERYLIAAIEIYSRLKAEDKKLDAFSKLHEVQKKKVENLRSDSFSIDVTDVYQYLQEKFSGLSIEESIIDLASLIEFFSKEELKNNVIESAEKHAFKSMVSEEVINSDGQTIIRIPPIDLEDTENVFVHMLREANRREEISGKFFFDAVKLVRDAHGFEDGCIDFLFEKNWIIPKGRENIIKVGILHCLRDEMYEGLHILAPQTENIFRSIAKEVGAITEIIEKDGTIKEKTMSSVLELPELKDCYDENRLFLFRGLLNTDAGANIRNRIAHGIMTPEEANSGVSYYFVGAILRLIVMASPNALNILIDRREKKESQQEKQKSN